MSRDENERNNSVEESGLLNVEFQEAQREGLAQLLSWKTLVTAEA